MQLEVGAAIAGGVGLAGIAIWAVWRYQRKPAAEPAPVDFEPVFETPASRPRPIAPRAAAPPPPPASPRAHAERAPAMVLTQGVSMQDAEFERRAPARAQPPVAPMRAPPPLKTWAQQTRETTKPEVPTEWARRQVGPVGPGRVAGVCGGCGTRLSVSDLRPLNVKCPVCGRAKLVA